MTDHPGANNSGPFGIAEVARRIGIPPATLRAWERRYGLVRPSRTIGGHRLYDAGQAAMLAWIGARVRQGTPISDAIRLWRARDQTPPDETGASDRGRRLSIAHRDDREGDVT